MFLTDTIWFRRWLTFHLTYGHWPEKKASSIKLAGMLLSLSLTTIHWAQNNSCAWLNIINSRYEYIGMVFRENKFPKKTYLHRDKLSRQTLTYLHHSQQQPSCTYTKTILNDKNNNTSFQFTLWNYRHYIWSSVSPFLSNTIQQQHIHPTLFFTEHRSTTNKFRHKRSFEWISHENDRFPEVNKEELTNDQTISKDNPENTYRCHHGFVMTLRKCKRFIEKHTETVRV